VFARWGFTHAALVALWLFAAMLAAGAVLPPDLSVLGQLSAGAAIFGGAAVLVGGIARRTSPDGLRALGLWPGRTGRAVLVGVGCYVLLFPGLLGLGRVAPWLVERLGGTFAEQPFLPAFEAASGPALAWGLVLAIGIVPFLEELLFRAFLQPLLVQNFGAKGGIAATAAIFGALHGESAFLPVFGLALVLGGVMLRTQRLVAAWAVHALHNGIMIAIFFLVPGLRELVGGPTGG
jgi:membrane protease YdiL (CAAX protease family)